MAKVTAYHLSFVKKIFPHIECRRRFDLGTGTVYENAVELLSATANSIRRRHSLPTGSRAEVQARYAVSVDIKGFLGQQLSMQVTGNSQLWRPRAANSGPKSHSLLIRVYGVDIYRLSMSPNICHGDRRCLSECPCARQWKLAHTKNLGGV